MRSLIVHCTKEQLVPLDNLFARRDEDGVWSLPRWLRDLWIAAL